MDSITIIDDDEKTTTCGSFPWKVPKLRIAPAVRSLYFRLRGRTEVTPIKNKATTSQDVQSIQTKEVSQTEGSPLYLRSGKTEPMRNIMFTVDGSSSHQSFSGRGSPASYRSPRSSMNIDVSHVYSSPSLPGAVEESFAFVPPHKIPQNISSRVIKSSFNNEENSESIVRTSAPSPQSTMGMIHQDEKIKAPSPPTSPHTDDQALTPVEQRRMEAAPSPSESTSGSLQNSVDCDVENSDRPDEGSEDNGREDDHLVEPLKTDTVDMAEEHTELEEELDFYENNDEEGDDDLDMDKVLRNCPPTEVLQNLTDMVQLSKNMTNQIENALRRTARITCGPFPRLPRSGLTKAEVIDLKCQKLGGETEEFLGDLNSNFMTFYTVFDEMDKVAAEQDSYVSSVMIKRGPTDWRREHAKTVRRMQKLWSKEYSRIITRKVIGRIEETIQELEEE